MTTAVTAALFVTLAALTSIPAFTKYTSAPIAVTIAYISVLSVMLALYAKLVRRIMTSRRVGLVSCAVFCLVLATANGVLYPRTRMTPARSSAPDAMIEPAVRALQGTHPYTNTLFDGAPISPGPGWIALHAPLTTTGAIWLLVPLHLMLAAWILARHHVTIALAFVTLMMALPAFLQMSFVGHDLFAVGCAMLTVTLGAWRDASRGIWRLVGWSVAAGTIATARAPLAVFVGALALLIGRRDAGNGITFFGLASSTLLVIHLLVFWWGHSLGLTYQPLHVLARGGNAGVLVMPIGVVLCVGLALWQWRRGTGATADALMFAWAVVGLPFVIVGIGELLSATGMDWANWEGKVYVGFALPLLIGAMLLQLNPQREIDSR
ncbi:MAG: hypothetical protein ACRD2X_08020 [Vicinamibacteraceae bacterium]